MIYNDHALDTFYKNYAKDLILCCFGDEAENYAEDFKFTEFHFKKYYNNIISNKSTITNKHVLEIGSNTGIWAVLMLLNGATHVTCVEPRPQLYKGIVKFLKIHDLPITVINSTHECIFDLNQKFDTTIMMGVDDLIPDIITFVNKLQNISKYLILKTKDSDSTVDVRCSKIIVEHNLHHRAGIGINTNVNSLNTMGYQTTANEFVNNSTIGRFIRIHYGKEFYETVFDYLDYKIVNFFTYDNDVNDIFKVYLVKLNNR
jgi:predicted RNA methylase